MRCNWRRWLWGVIPLVCVSVAAVHLERDAIERDLTDRARQVLAAGGAYWADVNFSGRDVVLTGSATADNEPPEAEAVLRKVWGVRHVNNNAGLPPKIEPYLWRAHRRGDRVRVFGHAPNRATRQIIIGMINAALPGLEVTDRMRAGRGVPPMDTWLAGVSFALKQLAALKKGEVRLEDLALTVVGETENAAEYRAVSAALKGGLPKGISLAGMKIAAPVVSPYTWSAQFAGGQLVLSGHVGDDSAKAEMMAAAAAAPAGTGVVDRLETARGAPADFAAAASVLIRQLVKLQSGNAELKDTAASIGGVAAGEAQAAAVREALRTSMPAAFKLTDQIRVQESPKAVRAEPKVERKIEAKPAVPAPADQQPVADLRPKVDMQPVPASPAPPEAQPKVDVEPEVKMAARPPAEAPPPPAPQPAPPAAAPAEEAQAKVAAASPPAPAPSAPAAGVSPAPPAAAPAPAPAPAAPPAPTPPPEAAPAPAASAAMPAQGPEPAQPSSEPAVCRDDLGKLAAANPISFERGSARLDAAGLAVLAKIAAAVKSCPGVRIAAEGHTDIEGGPDYNRRLSIKRARAVAACLIENGVGADQVEAAGFGSSRPAAPNTTVQARAKNRRAEILVRPK